jgi:hypothetical protein
MKAPQEKKRLSYAKDRRNTYGPLTFHVMHEKVLRMARYCLVLVTGLMLTALLACTPSDSAHLGDDQLIRSFVDNKPEFAQLVVDLKSDCKKGLTRIDFDQTDPPDPQTIGISGNQIRRYKDRFEALGIRRGYASVANCQAIELTTSTQGLAVSGSSKGYYYSDEPPRNIVKSLESYDSSFKYGAYRALGDDWYLYYSE